MQEQATLNDKNVNVTVSVNQDLLISTCCFQSSPNENEAVYLHTMFWFLSPNQPNF